MISHEGCVHAVPHRGGTAALDMAKNSGAGVNAGGRLNLIGQLLRAHNAFRDDDDKVLFAGHLGLAHPLQDIPLKIKGSLRQQHGQRAGGNAHIEGNITGMMAHNLHHRAAVMALGGVAQLVNGFHGGVHRGIVTDGILTARNIIVDGTGNADAGHPLVGKCAGAHKGTVAANNHQRVNSQFLATGKTLGLPFPGLELQTTGRIENGTAAVNNLGDAANIHLIAFAIDEAVITALNPHHAIPFSNAGTHNGTDCRVHTGSIAAAGQHTDGFNFLGHKNALLEKNRNPNTFFWFCHTFHNLIIT